MDYFIIYNSAVLEKDGKKMTLVCKDGTRKPFDNIWDFSTETFPTTEEYAKQFLSKKNEIVRSHFILRDCGTGAGGFKAGNACAKGGDGGGEVETEEEIVEFPANFTILDQKLTVREDLIAGLEGCGRVYPCGEPYNDMTVPVSDEAKSAAKFYSLGGDTPMLTSGSREWKSLFMFDEQTITYLKMRQLIPHDFKNEDQLDIQVGEAKSRENFAMINNALKQVHDELVAGATAQKIEVYGSPTGTRDLFRGMSVKTENSENLLAALKSGKSFDTESVSSWTKSVNVAEGFLAKVSSGLKDKVHLFLVGKNFKRGLDLDQRFLSSNQGEREIVAPPTRYKVKKVTEFRNQERVLLGMRVEIEPIEG